MASTIFASDQRAVLEKIAAARSFKINYLTPDAFFDDPAGGNFGRQIRDIEVRIRGAKCYSEIAKFPAEGFHRRAGCDFLSHTLPNISIQQARRQGQKKAQYF